jgi:hypothetical protein
MAQLHSSRMVPSMRGKPWEFVFPGTGRDGTRSPVIADFREPCVVACHPQAGRPACRPCPLGNAWAHGVSFDVNWPFDADGMFGLGFSTRRTCEGGRATEQKRSIGR